MKKIALILLACASSVWADATIRVGGSKWASVQDNGVLRVYNSPVGEIDARGNIRRNGTKVGEIDKKGRIRYEGELMGEIQSDGVLKYEGQVFGSIDAATGEIKRKGVVWGMGEGVTEKNRRGVAVLLFLFRDDFLPRNP